MVQNIFQCNLPNVSRINIRDILLLLCKFYGNYFSSCIPLYITSGGELARISLAIAVITAQVTPVPTLIFDEVDSGIGGAVAEVVGQLLRRLGQTRQVLCVTHLPQVASCGHQHWRVEKHFNGTTTLSQLRILDPAERVEEVARMLAGASITEKTRALAGEMLQH